MQKLLVIIAAATAITGCANQGPIIDKKGVDPAQYQRDLAECEAYADEVHVARKAGTGAVVGAVVGAAVGAAVGNHETAQRGAAAGGVVGGAKGTARGVQKRHQVVGRCLSNRGYSVLG